MRQLASIQFIKDLSPIEGADFVEKATVLGWELVVKKGEFQVGDKCVYCEVDSVLPDKPEFEFLKPRGFRIKTVKLKGQISQGIAFSLDVIPDKTLELSEGLDVTELLEITKHEPHQLSHFEAKALFPHFIRKTDETRIQSIPDVLERYVGTKFFIAEKFDGQSCTFYWNNGKFGVCSRNLELKLDSENNFTRMAKTLDLENKLRVLGLNIAFQGELVGEGIQGNKYKLKGQSFYCFNVFDIDSQKYFDYEDYVAMCDALEINHVPILHNPYELAPNLAVNDLVWLATRKSVLNPKIQAEGIVVRPITEKLDKKLGRLSFKVINPQFLLKYDE